MGRHWSSQNDTHKENQMERESTQVGEDSTRGVPISQRVLYLINQDILHNHIDRFCYIKKLRNNFILNTYRITSVLSKLDTSDNLLIDQICSR